MNQDKVTMKEKISYVLVNLGNIPITTLVSSFLLIFYTNVCGMNAAACATLFLIARILDGLNDPIVGFCIDHLPTTKWGHFRPPLIVGTILCCLNYLLLWFGPMMAPSGKLLIAYISYLLLGVIFPIMDISLNSMLSVMTTDMDERNTLSSLKGFFYMLGVTILGMAAPVILGDTSNKAGYIRLILIVTVFVLLTSVIGTMGLKERVKPQKGKKYGFKDVFTIVKQKPIWSTFVAALLYQVGFMIMNTVNSYYFTYVLGNFKLFSLVYLVQTIALFPPMLLHGKLVEHFGKKKLYVFGLMTFGVFPVIRLFNVTNIALLMLATVLIGLGQGMCMPLTYGIQADNTDYIELKLGQRAEGAIASLSSFITKFAMGVGGAIPGYLLAYVGFDGTAAVQPSGVNSMIVLCLTILPAAFSLIGILVFGKFYPLTKEKMDEQIRVLAEKRAKVEE